MAATSPDEPGRRGIKRLPAIAVVLVVVVVSVSVLGPYVNDSNRAWQVVKPSFLLNGTVARIPCDMIVGPDECSLIQNPSAQAVLIKYQGTLYYVSYFYAAPIWYTVWYGNNSAFCVSPKVPYIRSCPS